MFTRRTRDANIAATGRSSRSSSRCSCPKPFTTRTPVTSSSTTVGDVSPARWASQLANTECAAASQPGTRPPPRASPATAAARARAWPRTRTSTAGCCRWPCESGGSPGRAEVRVRPADELAGLELVVAGEVEAWSWSKIAVRRSCWTKRLTRPPANRRASVAKNRAPAMTPSATRSGASGSVWVRTTLSMTARCTSGIGAGWRPCR